MLRMENFRRSFSVKGKRPAIIALAVILFLAAAFYLPPGRSIVAACREDALMLKLVRASGAEFESVNITGWVRADESAGDPEALAERAAEQLGILLPGHKTEKWQNQYACGAKVEGAVTGGRTVSVLGQALLQPEGERVSHLMISLDGMDNGEALFYRQKVYKTLGAFGRLEAGDVPPALVARWFELQALAIAGSDARPLRIRLAAPTGKAAARLNESIAGAVAKLDLAGLPDGEAVRAAIPVEVTTLHRLLGSRPDTRHFRHHAGNPLPVDVLVVDEASMVDLEMMAAVLAALPPGARLVLLGDKDQLASVEAGAVLGELCRRAQQGHYSADSVAWLAGVTGEQVGAELIDPAGRPIDQAVAMLRHSYRFGGDSGIGQLAAAVNAGSVDGVRRALAHGHADLTRLALADVGEGALRRLVIDGIPGGKESPQGYRHYLDVVRKQRPPAGTDQAGLDAWAARVLAAHGQFQLLCALRRGPWGVEGLNRRIAGWLHEAGLIGAAEGWYAGRPVLVTRNDYGLGLMNGDIGITLALPGPDGDGPLRVAFPAGDGSGGIKWVQPSRLQAIETVYALTVHKSQGSEFTHTAMALPERLNPILTRELVYTGITRAKRWFSLVEAGSAAVLEQAVGRRVLRVSGLMEGAA